MMILILTIYPLFLVQAQEVTQAIINCNVITMKNDQVLQHQTILIANDKILKILPASQWINDQRIAVIDGSNRYVMPGLCDMHIHVNMYSNWIFDLLLSYGITTIRVMAGSEAVLQWRDSVKANLKLAPDMHVASQLIDGNPPLWGTMHEGPILQNPDSVEQTINDQISKGYEFIKVYTRLNPVVYKKIRDVCFVKGIKLTGHIPYQVEKKDMLNERTGEIEHLTGYARLTSATNIVSDSTASKKSDLAYDLELSGNNPDKNIQHAARETRRLGIWNCPTLVVEGIKTDTSFCKELPGTALGKKLKPYMSWWESQGYKMSINEKKHWRFQLKMVNELYKNGGLLLAGSDCPAPWVVPGLALHLELKYLVMAGLSNYDALKTATVNPAAWYGESYDKGTIEVGKRADLLILSANPLEDITNTQKIETVIFKGKVLPLTR